MSLDKRLEVLDQIIALQQQSLNVAQRRFEFGRGSTLPVRRFQAEVAKNQSEKVIVHQEIIEAENRINFLVNRYPQPVERSTTDFYNVTLRALSLGVPSQLLQNRPDIRQAERELVAAGIDIKVARAHFFPQITLTAGVGYQAFNPKYLFWTPASLIGGVAGDLVAPLINKRAIQAEFISANAKQLEALYNYQRLVLNAFTEVINRVTQAENFRKSIQIKQQQLEALVNAVSVATQLFNAAQGEYIDVLFSQRDLNDARTVLIDTKRQQLIAIVNAYQALGGGQFVSPAAGQPQPLPPPEPAPPPMVPPVKLP
jgi:outer membrane protein TolC